MSGNGGAFSWESAEKDLAAGIDTSVPVSARIWNYWLGGKDFYPVDKTAGDQFAQLFPGVFGLARSTRYYIARVVRHLTGEAGIRQFLDIGTGLPSHDNTHEIAQRVAPETRVVYVDNDPSVLSHARALLRGSPPGVTDFIDADLNHPDALLRIARQKLDFTRPVAIMLMGILGHIGDPDERDDEVARSIVDALKGALSSGSYLALYEATDADPAQNEATRLYNQSGAAPYHLRRPDQISRFFDGLELIEPGAVPIQDWRPDHNPFGNGTQVPAVAASQRKRNRNNCHGRVAHGGLSGEEASTLPGNPPTDHTAAEADELPSFDTTVANPARMWDYWLGGKDNFPADQEAAEAILEVMPSLPQTARIARRFLVDVVRRLMLEAGIRQFLDIGSGLPTADNTHEVAQRTAPEARIVYVDNDPLVLTHARALLTSTPEGKCAYIHADLRDAATILHEAAATLDFSQPIAILLLGILHFIPEPEDPWAVARNLMESMPSDSYLVIGHGASDIQADAVAEMTERYNEHSAVPFIPRTNAEVTRFFDGLELMPPGVVPVHQWWESDPEMATSAERLAGYTGYCGAGRKP